MISDHKIIFLYIPFVWNLLLMDLMDFHRDFLEEIFTQFPLLGRHWKNISPRLKNLLRKWQVFSIRIITIRVRLSKEQHCIVFEYRSLQLCEDFL